jgi:hypothetical protein
MAMLKSTFAWIKGFDHSALASTAARLRKITFGLNSEEQVLAVDVDDPRLAVEVAARREREVPAFDAEKGVIVSEKRHVYRTLYFMLDSKARVVSTSGARRDLALCAGLLKRAGAGGVELGDFHVDLLAWTRAFLKLYDTSQLAQLTLDRFYCEPKLIGRYTAKTLDNRLDLEALTDLPGQLRSIRLSFFHYDVRRSIEARSDGVLAVTSGEEEDLVHFSNEQVPLLIKHASRPATGESV